MPFSAIIFSAEGGVGDVLCRPCPGIVRRRSGPGASVSPAAAAPLITASLALASDGGAFGRGDLAQHAARRGRNLDRDLVGFPARRASRPGPLCLPTALNQVATVASVTLSPKVGTITSTRRRAAALRFGLRRRVIGLFRRWPRGGFGTRFAPLRRWSRAAHRPRRFPPSAGGRSRPMCRAAGEGTSTVTLSVSSSQSIFIDRHGLARFLEPGRNGGFSDAFAQCGYADFGCHDSFSLT